MSKTRRFFATSLLVVSISAVAFAEGGDTQSPPQAPQPPSAENTIGGTGIEPLAMPQDSSVDIITEATIMLAMWLEAAIF